MNNTFLKPLIFYSSIFVLVYAYLALIGCNGSNNESISTSTSLNCDQIYPNMLPTNTKFPGMDELVTFTNSILGEDAVSLVAGWKYPSITHFDSNEIPLYIMDLSHPGRYGIVWVPSGRKCIMIDASLISNSLFTFSGRTPIDDGQNSNIQYLGNDPAYVYMLVYLLLHEVGHLDIEIFNKDRYRQLNNDEVCNSYFDILSRSLKNEFQNKSCERKKVYEIFADQYAASKLLSANAKEAAGLRYETALRVRQAIYIAAMYIVFERVEKNVSKNREQQSFFDSGFSHPNTELRLLIMLSHIDPKIIYMVDDFLKSRNGMVTADNREALEKLKTTDLSQILAKTDSYWEDRMTAAELIGERGDLTALNALLEVLEYDVYQHDGKQLRQYITLRNEVIRSLGKIGGKKVVPTLITFLNDNSVTTRIAIIYSLGDIRDSSAVVPLIELAKSKDRWDKIAAIESLGKIGDSRSINPLLKLLPHQHGLALKSLSGALVKLNAIKAIPMLMQILDEDIDESSKESVKNTIEILSKKKEAMVSANLRPRD